MNCRTAQALMIRMRCTLLPERESTDLEHHLEGCRACRTQQQELRLGLALLEQIEALPVPTGLARRALQQHGPPALTRSARPPVVLGARFAVAAAASGLLAGLVAHYPRRPPTNSLGAAPLSGTSAQAQPAPFPHRKQPAPDKPGFSSRRPLPEVAATPQPVARVSPVPLLNRVRLGLPRKSGLDDLDYLDGFDPALSARWLSAGTDEGEVRELLERQLARIAVRDDFVEIPLPRLAAAAPRSTAARSAVKQYEKEAQVVDPRLFRKVTLRLRRTPLADLCKQLQQQTGVPLTASRSVADENVTLFVKDLAARDVMRAVARLFGYKWSRSGEEPAFRYELYQDLRSQIAEEQLRNREVSELLLALDEQLAAYRPYLDLSPEEIQKRLRSAQGAERYLLRDLADWNWGAVQVYHRLSPAQRQALAAGETLEFRTDARSPELRLPGEWREILLPRTEFVVGTIEGQSQIAGPNAFKGPEGPRPTTPLVGHPGVEVGVRLELRGLQAGQASLASFLQVRLFNPDGTEAALAGSKGGILRSAERPAGSKPRNALLNAKLRETAPYRQMVTLRPKTTCPWFTPEGRAQARSRPRLERDDPDDFYLDVEGQIRRGEEPPHVTSAEVWEAIHDATGMPIAADAYSRLFDAGKLEVREASRFDALCRLGDSLGVRWQQDGVFLLGRSTTYLWDKLQEVPARYLQRWQANREAHGHLPLEDLLEASTLSDRQLDAQPVSHVIGHCWGLEDWIIVGEGATVPLRVIGPHYSRPYARFLAQLAPAQRARALGAGLTFAELGAAQQEALVQLLLRDQRSPREAIGVRFRVDYAPAGTYVWYPSVATKTEADQLERTAPFVSGKTAEETLAAARKIYPRAQPQQIHRSRGILAFSFTNPASGAGWTAGWIGVTLQ